MSVGTDHIDVLECKRRDIYVATTPDIASDSAAELTVALILMVTRRIPEGRLLCDCFAPKSVFYQFDCVKF